MGGSGELGPNTGSFSLDPRTFSNHKRHTYTRRYTQLYLPSLYVFLSLPPQQRWVHPGKKLHRLALAGEVYT